MLGRVEWRGNSRVDCFNEAGDKLEIDWNNGPSPVQVTLQMIGACSLADIQTGLKDRKVDKIWIELDAERAESAPRVFTKVNMVYYIEGEAPKKLVKRLVHKSHEMYCSVSNMFNSSVEFTSSVVVNGEVC
ncbi:MAG: OsmC family protein [Candidatus Thermoplasmatota archaeon]|nr:OsmC family protein [Candidatus Thermoplasmatota archaeon]MEC8242294.1 OsmC family protein [Candidatus Thermoplasmatota archaeon]MEC8249957.1 OsmC family protein [Candidatus Thermoplasmatota archaeon]MEC8258398.1 OsmC family protein [Candidatus Thermoplasmatota archaeon]MEC8312345.1 OsmC family protein [Candidatus Thermoplasmatota archaeon]